MVEQIKKLLIKYRELISYVFFGAITTFINIATYYVCFNLLAISNVPSNIIAWIFSVLFAFVTNKLWVFESKSWKLSVLIKEFSYFISVRLLTGFVDTSIMYVGVDLLNYDGLLVKILSNLIVLISNFIGSKYLIFKKK